MVLIMRLLLSNQQGGPLAQMAVSPDQSALCRTLTDIVVHTVSVIMSKTNVDLLAPFEKLLTKPTDLKVRKNTMTGAYSCGLNSYDSTTC